MICKSWIVPVYCILCRTHKQIYVYRYILVHFCPCTYMSVQYSYTKRKRAQMTRHIKVLHPVPAAGIWNESQQPTWEFLYTYTFLSCKFVIFCLCTYVLVQHLLMYVHMCTVMLNCLLRVFFTTAENFFKALSVGVPYHLIFVLSVFSTTLKCFWNRYILLSCSWKYLLGYSCHMCTNRLFLVPMYLTSRLFL